MKYFQAFGLVGACVAIGAAAAGADPTGKKFLGFGECNDGDDCDNGNGKGGDDSDEGCDGGEGGSGCGRGEKTVTLTLSAIPVTHTVTSVPDAVTEYETKTVNHTPKPVTEYITSIERGDPITRVVTQKPKPVTEYDTKTLTLKAKPTTEYVTESGDDITHVVTQTPMHVTEYATKTITARGEPITERVTETETVTRAGKPVTAYVTEYPAPTTRVVTEHGAETHYVTKPAPAPVTVTQTVQSGGDYEGCDGSGYGSGCGYDLDCDDEEGCGRSYGRVAVTVPGAAQTVTLPGLPYTVYMTQPGAPAGVVTVPGPAETVYVTVAGEPAPAQIITEHEPAAAPVTVTEHDHIETSVAPFQTPRPPPRQPNPWSNTSESSPISDPLQPQRDENSVAIKPPANEPAPADGHSLVNYMSSHDTKELGIDSVRQAAGYADMSGNTSSLFYWFFESRNDPKTDPIMLWVNGGMGCSVMKALWVNGPSLVQEDLSMHHNPYSWNENMTIIYLDQPTNTGMSIGSQTPDTAEHDAEEIYEFLRMFFERYPEYQGNDFHLSGQSDSGHVLAATGAEILTHPDRNFKFSGLSIANGLIDSPVQFEALYPYFCGHAGESPILDEDTCREMAVDVPKCVKKLEDYDQSRTGDPMEIMNYCSNVTYGRYDGNLFDIIHSCADGSSECYPGDEYYLRYMNQPHVQEVIGARKSNFLACNHTIAQMWVQSGAMLKSNTPDLGKVLDANVPVLLIAGDDDGTYGWVGMSQVAERVPWAHQQEYDALRYKPWSFKGEQVGEVTNFDKLTFARMYNSSHLIAASQPDLSLAMINAWTHGNYALDF